MSKQSSTSELFSQLCASQDPSSLLRNYLPSIAESHCLDWFYSLLSAGERGATATLEARWETVAEGQALWREAGFESREQYQMHDGFAKLLDEMLRSQDVRKPRAVSVDPDLAKGRTCCWMLRGVTTQKFLSSDMVEASTN